MEAVDRLKLTLCVCVGMLAVGGFAWTFHPSFPFAQEDRPPTATERAIGAKLVDVHTDLDELGRLLMQHYDEVRQDDLPPVGCANPWANEMAWGGMEARSGEAHQGITLAGPNWTGLLHDIPWGTLDGYSFTDGAIVSAEVWAARQYRVRSEVLFQDSTFGPVRREHTYYANVAGYNGLLSTDTPALTFRRCLFDSPGSQAIQLVYRPQEQGVDFQALGDGTPGGLILVEDCLIRNAGWNQSGSGRASFALSFFWSFNPVEVRGTVVDCSMQALSRGAIMADSHGRVLVEDCTFVMGVTDRPIGLFERIGNLTLRRCTFIAAGGQTTVKINACPEALVEDCQGNALLMVNGVHVGSISDGLAVGAGPELPPGAPMPREVAMYTQETGIPVPD